MFQFLIGTLQTLYSLCPFSLPKMVSIPYRYSSNPDSLSSKFFLIKVSIPYRYSSNILIFHLLYLMDIVSIPYRYSSNPDFDNYKDEIFQVGFNSL